MKILVINCGSSSLKYQLINMEDESVLAKGLVERIGIDGRVKSENAKGKEVSYEKDIKNHIEAFNEVKNNLISGEAKAIASLDEISAIGHRVVQGGDKFTGSVLVKDGIVEKLEAISSLSPLHAAANLQGYAAAKAVFGDEIPQVFVFDTTFHSTMPAKAYTYPIPYELAEKHSIRKYGFHGSSHRFVSDRLRELRPELKKVVICHLGNGSSLSAVLDGTCVDTSMGLTPLDGFIMGTRCGSIDPSVVTYLQEKENLSPAEVSDILNKKSGFLGLSGVSSDTRDVEEAAQNGNKRAALALEMLQYQVAKLVASYAVALGGLDAVCFTAGIGENSASTRKGVCDQLKFLGVEIDDEKNNVRGVEQEISSADSKVKVFLIPTNEELMIARDTKALVEQA